VTGATTLILARAVTELAIAVAAMAATIRWPLQGVRWWIVVVPLSIGVLWFGQTILTATRPPWPSPLLMTVVALVTLVGPLGAAL
jgi:hypothetical protein